MSRSLYYCLFTPHIYGVVLCTHSICGEPRIQCKASDEVATVPWGFGVVFTSDGK